MRGCAPGAGVEIKGLGEIFHARFWLVEIFEANAANLGVNLAFGLGVVFGQCRPSFEHFDEFDIHTQLRQTVGEGLDDQGIFRFANLCLSQQRDCLCFDTRFRIQIRRFHQQAGGYVVALEFDQSIERCAQCVAIARTALEFCEHLVDRRVSIPEFKSAVQPHTGCLRVIQLFEVQARGIDGDAYALARAGCNVEATFIQLGDK